MKRSLQNLLIGIGFGLGTVFVLPVSGAWQEANGACRKEIRVEGGGGASVTATTTVFLDDRYTGFVLVDEQGAVRACSLLCRTGSRVAFHFEAKAGETLYLYPSVSAPLPQPGADHQSGLRRLTRRYDGREVASAAQFEELWKSAAFEGGEFADQIYSAFNPFGPSTNALHRYDGVVKVGKDGPATFCVASTDASFLLIDGHEVAAWPGRHDVKEGQDGSKRGTVTLTAGPHRIAFLHANGTHETSYAIAAMVLQGESKPFVIGPEYFTSAAYAYVGPLVQKDGQPQADFIWDNRYMVTIQGHGLYDLTFEAAAPKDAPNASFEWDFGDGAHASGTKAEHLYFACGDVPVTLTMALGNGQKVVSRQTVRVTPRHGQSENDDGRSLALINQAAAQERDSRIQPEGYALISHGYFFFLEEAKAAAFAERVFANLDRIPEADLCPMMLALALNIQAINEPYELAERCFRVVLAKSKDPKMRASAALHFGGMLNLCLNRPSEARDVLNAIKKEDLTTWEPRLLEIYLADTVLVLEDYAKARNLYLAIPKPVDVVNTKGLDRGAMFDYNSRYFRLQNLLSQHLYEESLRELDMIEWDLPEERASPRMNLLKVQALVGNKQPRKAVVCLQRALLADVDETYTPALRLELAKLYFGMDQLAQAKHQIDLIRKESPWTAEEIEARKLSEEIEHKLGEVKP